MFRIYLSINDEKRQILSLHYEYFHPVYKSEDEYRKTLYKNYPYKFEDKYDLSPYRDYELPVLGNGPLDSHLAYEAKQTVSEIQTGGYWSRDKSNREMYYDALTRLRYGKRLDRGIIPNLNHLYDMELRPSEAPGRHWSDIVIGGHFSLLLESTDNDLFFYEWLSTGRLHQGELQVFTGDSGNYFRIRFWDCYCVGVGEQMSALSACPMLMSLYLSPAVVENRGVKFEKIWKKTEIKREPFKAGVVAIETANEKLQITAVEGTKVSHPKGTLIYKVIAYNRSEVTASDRIRTKWSVEIDGKEYPQNWQGDQIQVTAKDEWVGKEIIVKPYLDDKLSQVSVKTKVIEFKKCVYFARSERIRGMDLKGNLSEDMKYGDVTAEELIRHDKGYEPLLKLNDMNLFNYQYMLAGTGSIIKGGTNSREVIDHFKKNIGTEYSSQYMNEQLKNHKTLKLFVYNTNGVLDVLCKQLSVYGGNINKVPLLIGAIESTRVKFTTKLDLINGMSITVDDTVAYEVYVEDYELISKDTFNCKLRIKIYDHYGLDRADVDKNDWHVGFKAWYILQHVRGYRPFLTCMECVVDVNNQKF